jgi:acetyl esterase/lipase
MIADLDTYDASPRAIAKNANVLVVSVHYRQAPEHKFPAAHNDAVAAKAKDAVALVSNDLKNAFTIAL